MKMNKLFWIIAILVLLIPLALAQNSGITLSLLSYDPTPVQPGQTIDVFIQVANTGTVTRNTQIFYVEEYPFTLLQTEDSERAQNLGPVAFTHKLHYRFKIDGEVSDGITPLKFKFKANDGDGFFGEAVFNIDIQTFDSTLNIISVKQTPEELEPGQQGKITLLLQNMNDKPLKNMDVIFDLTGSFDISEVMDNMLSMQALINARLELVNRRIASGQSPLAGPTTMSMQDDGEVSTKDSFTALAPVGTTNRITINQIQPGEKLAVEFDVVAMPNAEPNIYSIPTFISYNDDDNNPFIIRANSPVRVNMKPELHVELKSADLRTTDFSGKLEIQVANRGLSILDYVTVHLVEDETYRLLAAPKTVYLGTLNSRDSKIAEFEVIPEDKLMNISLLIEYRDSFNEKYEKKIQLQHEVINRNYYRYPGFELWLVWLILGLVLLVAGIYYVKKMKNGKG